MDDHTQDPPLFESIKQTHKGGSIIQKVLNMNNEDTNEFSMGDYKTALVAERVKRQQQLRANNEEFIRRRELRLKNGIIYPQKTDNTNLISQDIQTQLAQTRQHTIDMQNKLRDRLIAERARQIDGAKIRKRNNEIFEMRENAKRLEQIDKDKDSTKQLD